MDMTSARLLGDLTPAPGQSGKWLRPERLLQVEGLEDMSYGTDAGEWRRTLATLDGVACLGDRWELQLRGEGQRLLARGLNAPTVGPGAMVVLRWRAEDELALGEGAAMSAAGWSSVALRL